MQFFESISQNQKIIVAVCKDECSKKLSENARNWFESLGSLEIMKLGHR